MRYELGAIKARFGIRVAAKTRGAADAGNRVLDGRRGGDETVGR